MSLYSILTKFFLKYSFQIILIIVILFLFLSLEGEKNSKENIINKYENTLNSIEKENIKTKNKLLDNTRKLEIELRNSLKESSKLKEIRDEEVLKYTSIVDTNIDRLRDLTKRAIEADKHQCTDTSTTKVVEKIVRVPTTENSAEITAEMAEDFRNQVTECSINYSLLKNEALELQDWAVQVEQTVNKNK